MYGPGVIPETDRPALINGNVFGIRTVGSDQLIDVYGESKRQEIKGGDENARSGIYSRCIVVPFRFLFLFAFTSSSAVEPNKNTKKPRYAWGKEGERFAGLQLRRGHNGMHIINTVWTEYVYSHGGDLRDRWHCPFAGLLETGRTIRRGARAQEMNVLPSKSSLAALFACDATHVKAPRQSVQACHAEACHGRIGLHTS